MSKDNNQNNKHQKFNQQPTVEKTTDTPAVNTTSQASATFVPEPIKADPTKPLIADDAGSKIPKLDLAGLTPADGPVVVTTKVGDSKSDDLEKSLKETDAKTMADVIEALELPKDKLHAKNLAKTAAALLEYKTSDMTSSGYVECATYVVSLTNSLSVLSDVAFVMVFPAFLDILSKRSEVKGVMFTDTSAVFKIFSIGQHSNKKLTRGHARFIAALSKIAPIATRKRSIGNIDLNAACAILPDVKRSRIIDYARGLTK